MIKKAFTLIELVFVILIIGIMTGVASSAFKTNYLLNDTNFIALKIKNAQFQGIGHEHLDFGGTLSSSDERGCIRLEKSALDENATNANEMHYRLHVTLSPEDTTICFDAKGRPHKDSFDGELYTFQESITLSYSGREKIINIQALTGYVIVTE
jgi:prepilin-type N-terminal cleavage/methylation domain-containing protein